MAFIRTILLAATLVLIVTGHSWADDKSYYSPVIQIDTDNHRILISKLGGVFYIDVPEAAREWTGAELMTGGLRVTARERPQAVVVSYRRL